MDKKNIIFIFFTIVLILLIPIIVLGEGAYVLIHDNLDSELVYLQMLKMSGQLFSFDATSVVPNVMNGIARGFFHSEFSLVRVFFYLLPPFWAYTINALLVRAIGFWGVVALGRMHFFVKDSSNLWGLPLVAAVFALMPVYSIHGATIMGQAFLLWAFLNLLNHRYLAVSFLTIVLFPFYAHFALVAPFILVALLVFGLVRIWNSGFKGVTPSFWVGVILLLMVFVLANFNLIFGFLKGNIQTHRLDWHFQNVSFKSVVIETFKTLFKGQYHAANFLALPTYILLFQAIVRANKLRFLFFSIGVTLGFIALFHGGYAVIRYLLQDSFSVVKVFNFNRFTFLMPILLVVSLLAVRSCKLVRTRTFNLLMLVQIVLVLFSAREKEIVLNYAKVFLPMHQTNNIVGFRHFFAADVFQQIDTYIRKPKHAYRVVSLGLHPSIAQYNGFFTLDGYMNNYPLLYKRSFRSVISAELAKDDKLLQYFDEWGSRCYFFSAELYKSCYVDCRKINKKVVKKFEINTTKLKEMGASYIFSAVPIANAQALGLQLEKVFSSEQSIWQIYLYKIN